MGLKSQRISEAQKRRHAATSIEDRRAASVKMNDAARSLRNEWTPEERAANSKKFSEIHKKRHAETSPEDKARASEKRRQSLLAYWADKKGKQKESERSQKISASRAKYQQGLSQADLDAQHEHLTKISKLAALTPRRPLSKEKLAIANRKRQTTWTQDLRDSVSSQVKALDQARSPTQKAEMTRKRLATYHARSPDQKAITSAKLRNAYDARSPEQKTEIFNKVLTTKRANGSFHTSKPEEAAYRMLVDVFGEDKVYRNYFTQVYPHACDFVINPNPDNPCRLKDAIFIECNFHWTHGGEPYDALNPTHAKRLRKLKKKAKSSDYAATAISVWTERDPKKRSLARESNLSWFEFWRLSEVRDWLNRFTTAPKVVGSYTDEELIKAHARITNGRPRFVNEFTFNFQPHFYKEELRLWADPVVRARLLANREKYLSKRSAALTDQEILSGFRKASLARIKYSHFPVFVIKEFLSIAKPKFVYDPCAGWGTRLVTFNALGVKYLGNDNWGKTVDGCRLIVRWLHSVSSTKCKIVQGDSAEQDVRKYGHDSVFTCPPYPLNAEVYNGGAESLPIDAYWEWWSATVKRSLSKTVRHVGIVVPEKWQNNFAKPLEKCGFTLVHSSHVLLSGRKDTHLVNRKNLEVMLVWKR